MKNKLIVLMGLAIGLFLINCAGENANMKAPENGLVIATGDKSSGAISVIDIQTKTAFNNLLSVHHNSQIRAIDNKPYLLERLGANNLKFFNKKNNYSLVYEQSLVPKVNPQDIVSINSEYAMIANRESNKLMVVKLSDGSIDASKEIGIPAECPTGIFDGGFSLFNLNKDFEEQPLLLETDINGNVHDIELISDTKAFFIYYEGTGFSKMHVKVFNPTTKEITHTLLSNGNYSQLLVHNGKLYVADKNPKKPGIYIFDVNTLAQETTDPIDVGLPPKSMVVLEK